MNKQQLKEKYNRFKQWQQQPYEYKLESNGVHHCNNCGNEFTGNYCPICAQKADFGPITWHSVRQSVMDIWGLGTRSLPNTVWHLLTRPGYLISDYISGKRQVSFPPVKMLFFVAVIVVLLIYYLLPFLFGDKIDVYGGTGDIYVGFDEWNRKQFAWTRFVMAILFILPIWIMFRYAPRHTRHTLPQGFFIQVFLCVLNLVVSFIIMLPFLLFGYTVYLWTSTVVLLIYYIIAYKQLFGYGIWGTVWRTLIVYASTVFIIDALMYIVFQIDFSQLDPEQYSSINGRFYYAGASTAYGLMILAGGWIINLIVTYLPKWLHK